MSGLLSRKVLVPAAVVLAALVILFFVPIPGVVLPQISISAEHVFDLFGLPITNSLLASWLAMVLLILGSWAATRKMEIVPGRLQGLLEMIIEGLYNLVEGVAGLKWARQFFPTVMTIFISILASNWLGITPLYGGWGVLHHREHGQAVQWLNDAQTIGLWQKGEANHEEEVEGYTLAPMFRSAATDMNTTLALAIVSVAMTQYFGLKALGIGYLGKFVAVDKIIKAFTKPGLGCGGRLSSLLVGTGPARSGGAQAGAICAGGLGRPGHDPVCRDQWLSGRRRTWQDSQL